MKTCTLIRQAYQAWLDDPTIDTLGQTIATQQH
jgi:hypothetical protein